MVAEQPTKRVSNEVIYEALQKFMHEFELYKVSAEAKHEDTKKCTEKLMKDMYGNGTPGVREMTRQMWDWFDQRKKNVNQTQMAMWLCVGMFFLNILLDTVFK